MTTPMENLPHKTVLCMRDATDGLPLFVPDEVADQILTYALGVTCAQFEGRVEVAAAGYDLGREYIVLHDHTGNVSDFFERLHHVTALAFKKYYGLEHSLWQPHQQFRRRYLETPEDVLEAVAEIRAMPVREGRVKYANRYPGLILDDEYLEAVMIERPSPWLGDGYPDRVVLQLRRPPCFEHLSDREWKTRIRHTAQALESRFRDERRTRGEGYMGQARIRQLDPGTPLAERHRPAHVPRESVRARHDSARGRKVTERLRTFRGRYRPQWLRFAAGNSDVVFPAGTLQVARYAGATTADAEKAARRHGYPIRGRPTGA